MCRKAEEWYQWFAAELPAPYFGTAADRILINCYCRLVKCKLALSCKDSYGSWGRLEVSLLLHAYYFSLLWPDPVRPSSSENTIGVRGNTLSSRFEWSVEGFKIDDSDMFLGQHTRTQNQQQPAGFSEGELADGEVFVQSVHSFCRFLLFVVAIIADVAHIIFILYPVFKHQCINHSSSSQFL